MTDVLKSDPVSVTGAVILLATAVMGMIAIWIVKGVTNAARGDRKDDSDYDWDI